MIEGSGLPVGPGGVEKGLTKCNIACNPCVLCVAMVCRAQWTHYIVTKDIVWHF